MFKKQDLFKLIDGTLKPFEKDNKKGEAERMLEFAEVNSRGVGSSKAMRISRIIERIQGVKNSQYRILHTLDFYKRHIPDDEYHKDYHILMNMENITFHS